MAILFTNENGWIISHLKFFEKIRVSASFEAPQVPTDDVDNLNCSAKNVPRYLSLDPNLFEITEPFKDKINGKPVQNCAGIPLCDTTKVVKALSDRILNDAQCQKIFQTEILLMESNNKLKSGGCGQEEKQEKDVEMRKNNEITPMLWPKNNVKAVHACQQFFEKVKSIELPHFHGENALSDSAVFSTITKSSKIEKTNNISSHQFLFPPETKFYCNDVLNMEKVFEANDEMGFDVIVLDPPWWNKFIRRRKRKQHEAGYEMLDDDELAKLPINKFLNAGGIVVVWCTNAKSHQNKLINDIFPRWKVKYQNTLYWLKVTKTGQPICPFNVENRKQPYETIIVGRQEEDSLSKCVHPTVHGSKVVVSVPSSINSHKPPLINILKQMYPNKLFERKLEIFARYLTPGFISYGNEVVKLQHESLYINL